jgi:exosortase D (VPLPA-CTERM-specific)
MVGQWGMEEFSHGYLIPFISAYLIWQRRNLLRSLEFTGSWAGVIVVAAGIALDVAGRLASLYTIQHLALLVVIYGLVLSLTGGKAIKILAAPLGVLVFMIPLPNFILQALSADLQLISSTLGVWLIRLTGVSVFLEGNVIDLGNYRLEVAEACSGLRYLLPLMTLAFLMSCFFRAPWWKRTVLFLSSVPITLVMNSLRIAAIGVMVDRAGPSMAEGLLHQVQGWMVFMLSTGLLIAVVIALSRIGGDRSSWRQLFSLEPALPLPANLPRRRRSMPSQAYVAGAFVVLFGVVAAAMPASVGANPQRETFASFPLNFGDWQGRREVMDSAYMDTLKLDDYLLADYVHPRVSPVNVYVAWYNSQSTGEATHSPRTCLPGGGWRIEDFRQITVEQMRVEGQPLRVNRALIRYDDKRQLVYYWFQQRGRVVTNEYLVKWYLLVDSIRRHRTDGALVRLIVPVPPAMSLEEADRELQSFITAIEPRLERYLPS